MNIYFTFFIIGFAAISSQSIFIREFLSIFQGNEISITFILANWMLAGAIGSYTYFKIRDKFKAFNFSIFLWAYYLIISIILIQFIPYKLFYIPQQIYSPFYMFIICFLILLPANGILAALFAANSSKASLNNPNVMPKAIFFEAIGALSGGLFSVFLLMPFFSNLQSAIIITLSCLVLNSLFSPKKIHIFSFLFLIFLLIVSNTIDSFLLNIKYPGHEILVSKNSHYQNIVVSKKDTSINLFTNGGFAFGSEILPHTEFLVHLPILQHPNPKDILLIGNGMDGSCKEILKYDINSLKYLEFDNAIVSLEKIFPMPDNNKLEIIYTDPRKWLNQNAYTFDIIILNMPEPETILINRYYTLEFYENIKKHLNKNGVFSFSLSSSPNYLSELQRSFFNTIINTLSQVFDHITTSPGDTAYITASNNKLSDKFSWKFFRSKLKEKNIQTKYFNENYIFSDFSENRIKSLSKQLYKSKRNILNLDFDPQAYWQYSLLWISQFKKESFLSIVNPHNTSALSIFLVFFGFLYFVKKLKHKIFLSVFIIAFSETSLLMILLVIFQIIFSSVFWKACLLSSLFMLGTAFGCAYSWRNEKINLKEQYLYKLHLMLIGTTILLSLILTVLSNNLFSEILIYCFSMFYGIIGGIALSLNTAFLVKTDFKHKQNAAAMIYSTDLLGAFTGIITCVFLFIPLLGLAHSLHFISIFNTLILAVFYLKKELC